MNDPANTAAAAEREIFAAAAALGPEERAAFLDAACAGRPALRVQAEKWLRVHESSRFMEVAAEIAAPMAEVGGERIGHYQLLEPIGEGGFGVVWEAEQLEPVRRRVALKIIKLGMDTREVVARFEQERQALAMMDHSNIAKVFDAGATPAGRPFFVMELVPRSGDALVAGSSGGAPAACAPKITDYCEEAQLGIAERLRLFIAVCQAVQHAHQKGIIHRDLKPSNILVSEQDGAPIPKVIDFGVVKAIQSRLTDLTLLTHREQLLGTPLYMSPEQAESGGVDIDTRSDIFSLGVLLYELLTGRTPVDRETLARAGLDEVRRIIREQEPPRPSLAARPTHPIASDLDWIVMKALEKDRARRYETANGLAMDVLRHLNNEAVAARAPSNVYRFQKLVRRNKLAVAAASMVAGALIIGAAISIWQAIRATRAERAQTHLRQEAEESRNREARLRIQAEADEQRAITEAARSAQVAQFMQSMLSGVGPAVARGRDIKLLREILDQTAARLDELKAQPAVEADLRDTLGTVYRDLAELPAAEAMHRQALVLRKKLHGDEHASVATTLNNLGGVLHRQGNHPEAEKVYRQALEMQRKLLGHENRDVALTLNNLGSILRRRGKLPEAETTLREALAMRRQLLGHEHVDVAESLSDLGLLLRAQGGDQLTEAEALFRETLAIEKKLLGDDHPTVAGTLGDLGRTLDRQGRLPEAEATLRDSLALKKKLFGDEHPEIAIALNALVPVLSRGKKYAEAEPLQRQLLALQKKLLGDEHPDAITALTDLATLLSRQGKHAEAESIFREALALKKKLVGPDDPSVATLLETLGQTYSDRGKLLEAEGAFREALEIRKKKPGKDSDFATPLSKLAELLVKQRRLTEAEPLFREAIALQKRIVGEDDPAVATLLEVLGKMLTDGGKLAEAERAYRDALEVRKRAPGKPAELVKLLGTLARFFANQSRVADIKPVFQEVIEAQKGRFGDEDPSVLALLEAFAEALRVNGRGADAFAVFQDVLALRRKIFGDNDPNLVAPLSSSALALLYQGKFAEAEAVARESFALEQKVRGNTARSSGALAFILVRQRKYAEAEPILRQGAALGNIWNMFTLGELYLYGHGLVRNSAEAVKLFVQAAQGGMPEAQLAAGQMYGSGEGVAKNPGESAKWYGAALSRANAELLNSAAWSLTTAADPERRDGRNALLLAERAVTLANRTVPTYLDTLAAAYAEVGEFEKAAGVQKEAIALVQDETEKTEYASRLKLYESNTPYRDPESLARWVRELLAAEKFAEAEPLARQCLAIREQQIPDDWRALNAKSLLGGSLLGQSRYAEAEPLLLSGYEGMQQRWDKLVPNGKPAFREAIQRLVQLYETTARPEQAAEWRKKLTEFEQKELGAEFAK